MTHRRFAFVREPVVKKENFDNFRDIPVDERVFVVQKHTIATTVKLDFLSGGGGAMSVVQTVPAELVVVEVEPLPKSSYSFSIIGEVGSDWTSLDLVSGLCGSGGSSSRSVFRPESTWKEV